MYVYFRCDRCSQKLKVDFQHRGEDIACPTCEVMLEVPLLPVGPGVLINGFLIEEQIGEGGMGRVYRANQRTMNRPAALKILASFLTYDTVNVERFLQEARTMAALHHPQLVDAYDAGEDDGVYYIAMEYVTGSNIDELLGENGAMDESESLDIASRLASGLQYAWRQGKIIHRDIKPGNVMVDLEGEPRLLDLGLARSLEALKRLTMTGEVLGTPHYMSPEQSSGELETDFRTDIYGLGATLYSMLTGALPFGDAEMPYGAPGEDARMLDPRDHVPSLAPATVKMLALMLGKRPEDRHESWDDVIDDFKRVLRGEDPILRDVEACESILIRNDAAPKKKKRRLFGGSN